MAFMRTPPATIRIATPEDVQRIAAEHYPIFAHRVKVAPEETRFVADCEGHLVGTLLVRPKNGTLVVGLRVSQGWRHYGFGTQLLRTLLAWMGDRECYVTPDRRIVSFFAQFGFVEIAPEAAPSFLAKHIEDFNRELGHDDTIMRRG